MNFSSTTSALLPRAGLGVALVSVLGFGCQVGSTSQSGLISVDSCQECAPAYEECQQSGGTNCEAMMQECYAECEAPRPTDPGDCACHELFDSCMGQIGDGDQDDQDPDCDADGQRPDGTECDPGTGGDDDGTADQRWECEQIYRECNQACNEPPPPSQCEQCDAILDECFGNAQDTDDPVSVLRECIKPYVDCVIDCQGDGGGTDDPGHGTSCGDLCAAEHAACEQDAGDDEEAKEACAARNEACRADCQNDGDENHGDDPGCWTDFDQCLGHCGDGDRTREECEQVLEECQDRP